MTCTKISLPSSMVFFEEFLDFIIFRLLHFATVCQLEVVAVLLGQSQFAFQN